METRRLAIPERGAAGFTKGLLLLPACDTESPSGLVGLIDLRGKADVLDAGGTGFARDC